MWPAGGFDASPFSPAGEVQGLFRFAIGAKGLRGRRPPWPATVAAAVIIGFVVAVFVVLLVTH